MKINSLLIVIILASIMAKAQDITLKFTANHTCSHHAVDSIWKENLTQDGKMVLYYPDTIASFVFTNIEGLEPWNNNLYVSQNHPNPFSDFTYIDVYLTTPDVVSLNVFDMTGRIVAKNEDILEGGMHRYSFSTGVENSNILTVTSGKHIEKRIMLQMGAAGFAGSEISYLEASSEEEPKTAPKSADFSFNPGDKLRFTGYVTGCSGNMDYGVILDALEVSEEYFFDIECFPVCELTLVADPAGGGDVIAEHIYPAVDEGVIEATPDEGWGLVEWTCDTDYVDDPDSEQTSRKKYSVFLENLANGENEH